MDDTMNRRFWIIMALLPSAYLLLWATLLVSTAGYTTPLVMWEALVSREIRHAASLSIATSTISALLSLLVAVPAGYLLSRRKFPGRTWLEAVLDIPILLPPTVAGLCLLIFFQTGFGRLIEQSVTFTFAVAGVILAQFVVGAAFAIRTMRDVFHQLPRRPEDVALALGCTRWQAFWHVTLPAARRGIFAAFSIAWARSFGEFGPVLVFVGVTRMKTEVLPTSIWLAVSMGDLKQAVAVSLLMIVISIIVLAAVRSAGERT